MELLSEVFMGKSAMITSDISDFSAFAFFAFFAILPKKANS
jgi:hypothetical protein